jgi:hypothetical protein
MKKLLILSSLLISINGFAKMRLGECVSTDESNVKVIVTKSSIKTAGSGTILVVYPDQVAIEEDITFKAIGNKVRVFLENSSFLNAALGFKSLDFGLKNQGPNLSDFEKLDCFKK